MVSNSKLDTYIKNLHKQLKEQVKISERLYDKLKLTQSKLWAHKAAACSRDKEEDKQPAKQLGKVPRKTTSSKMVELLSSLSNEQSSKGSGEQSTNSESDWKLGRKEIFNVCQKDLTKNKSKSLQKSKSFKYNVDDIIDDQLLLSSLRSCWLPQNSRPSYVRQSSVIWIQESTGRDLALPDHTI